jgi:DNA-binding XRE family transcriptional regulator
MEILRIGMAESNAVRAYIRTLRSERNLSQDVVADAIHVARRTYIAWEAGNTIKDIKAPALIRAIKFLGGAFDHLGSFENASEEQATQMARDWVRFTPEQQAQVTRIREKIEYVVAKGEDDPVKLGQVIQQLRADAQTDPAVLDMVMAYLDGRRSASQ